MRYPPRCSTRTRRVRIPALRCWALPFIVGSYPSPFGSSLLSQLLLLRSSPLSSSAAAATVFVIVVVTAAFAVVVVSSCCSCLHRLCRRVVVLVVSSSSLLLPPPPRTASSSYPSSCFCSSSGPFSCSCSSSARPPAPAPAPRCLLLVSPLLRLLVVSAPFVAAVSALLVVISLLRVASAFPVVDPWTLGPTYRRGVVRFVSVGWSDSSALG